jgi:hypothetical protein
MRAGGCCWGAATPAAQNFLRCLWRRLRPQGHQPERVFPATDSWRRWFAEAATSWWIFRRSTGRSAIAGGRRRRGQSRAYLMDYGPDEVINWNHDRLGGLDWIVLRTSCLQQSKVTDARWEKETRWIYYDRENYQIYRKRGESSPDRVGRRRAARAGVAGTGAGIRDEGFGGACG